LDITSSKGLQIGFPFNGKHVFLLVVAVLAGRHDIALLGFAASGQRHDVIHGQPVGGKGFAAVIATSTGQLTLPPLGLSQFPGFAPFSVDDNIVCVHNNRIQTAKPPSFHPSMALFPLSGVLRGFSPTTYEKYASA
jgi:hypothetical protein